MNILDIFDKERGAQIRAVIGVVMAVATALLLFLQTVADTLRDLPGWKWVGAVAMLLQGAIVFLGRFVALGNKAAP